jgi:hypothetical protein
MIMSSDDLMNGKKGVFALLKPPILAGRQKVRLPDLLLKGYRNALSMPFAE